MGACPGSRGQAAGTRAGHPARGAVPVPSCLGTLSGIAVVYMGLGIWDGMGRR